MQPNAGTSGRQVIAAGGIAAQRHADYAAEAIETFAHIGGLSIKIEFDARGECDHAKPQWYE